MFRKTLAALIAAGLTFVGCSQSVEQASPEEREETETGSEAPSVDLGAAIEGFLADPTELSLEIATETLDGGAQAMTAEGVLDGELASLDIDASQAPNAAGFYGHYDEIPVVFEGTDAYFAVVPDDVWLYVTLERGSSFIGADIARLRDLSLANPVLMSRLLQDLPEATASGVTAESHLDFELTGDDSELVAQLEKLFGIHEVPISVTTDSDGSITKIDVTFVYEVVKDTDARNTVEVSIDVLGHAPDAVIELPDGESLQEL